MDSSSSGGNTISSISITLNYRNYRNINNTLTCILKVPCSNLSWQFYCGLPYSFQTNAIILPHVRLQPFPSVIASIYYSLTVLFFDLTNFELVMAPCQLRMLSVQEGNSWLQYSLQICQCISIMFLLWRLNYHVKYKVVSYVKWKPYMECMLLE
jgi:hypothetical protein